MKKINTPSFAIINSCCGLMIPFVFKTYFLGIPISQTILCTHCKQKVTARTLDKAIIKWNERFKL